jgi:hypothetical protein
MSEGKLGRRSLKTCGTRHPFRISILNDLIRKVHGVHGEPDRLRLHRWSAARDQQRHASINLSQVEYFCYDRLVLSRSDIMKSVLLVIIVAMLSLSAASHFSEVEAANPCNPQRGQKC